MEHEKDTYFWHCEGRYSCQHHKYEMEVPMRYNVTFVLAAAGHIRVSLTVKAESIGSAVLEAVKQLSDTPISVSDILYYQCAPVR